MGNPVAFSCSWLVFSAAVRKARSAAQLPVAVAASIYTWSPELELAQGTCWAVSQELAARTAARPATAKRNRRCRRGGRCGRPRLWEVRVVVIYVTDPPSAGTATPSSMNKQVRISKTSSSGATNRRYRL